MDGEHLINYTRTYEYALSTGYNAKPNTSVYGRGTGIFLHVWLGTDDRRLRLGAPCDDAAGVPDARPGETARVRRRHDGRNDPTRVVVY